MSTVVRCEELNQLLKMARKYGAASARECAGELIDGHKIAVAVMDEFWEGFENQVENA